MNSGGGYPDELKTFAYHSDVSSWQPQPADRIHFGPIGRWINDPCGLVQCEGVYHLFYQLNPHGTDWGNMHWGHAVSSNLIHWEHRPVAIGPHPELGMAFTGSIVIDAENSSGFFPESSTGFVALLTTARKSKDADTLIQTQSIAYSSDQGETWRWYSGNPVIADDDLRDFRDPKIVWHPENRRWVMCISAGSTIRFYNSNDLLNWEWMSSYEPELVPDVCECPVLIRFSGQRSDVWVLVYSLADPADAHFSGVRYVTGAFDGRAFHKDEFPERRLDQGPDFYAVQDWYGLPEGVDPVVIAWANNPVYSHSLASAGAGTGVMTLPRRISLSDGKQPTLLQRPATAALKRIPLEPARSVHETGIEVFDSVTARFPVQLELRFGAGDFGRLAVFVEAGGSHRDQTEPDVAPSTATHSPKEKAEAGSPDRRTTDESYGLFLAIEIDHTRERLRVTRDIPNFSVPEAMRETRTISVPEPDRPLDLIMIMDQGIVELFAWDGAVVATYLLPGHSDSLRVRVTYDSTHATPTIDGFVLVPRESNFNREAKPGPDSTGAGQSGEWDSVEGGDS